MLVQFKASAQIPGDTAALNNAIKTVLVTNGSKQITALQMRNLMLGITGLMKAYAVDSVYRVADTLFLSRRGGFTTLKVTLNTGGAPSESDPTVNAAAKTITSTDKSNWNGKQDALIPSTGISIIANVISAKNDSSIWNAGKLKGNPVSATTPVINQVLKWNGTMWAPANDSIGTGGGGGGYTPPGDNTKILVGDGTQQIGSTVKGLLGLNLIDNTSDINKPISTAQAAGINARIALDSTQNYTSGSTMTVGNAVNVVQINPASVISALTITLPSTAHNSNEIQFYYGGTITSGTVITSMAFTPPSGTTLIQAVTPGSVEAGETISFKKIGTIWYRKN